MYKLFDNYSGTVFTSPAYYDLIKEEFEAIVPQAVYGSDKAKIHIAGNTIAIDFVLALHEPVIRYEFSLPYISAFGNGKHPTTYMCLALLAETLHTGIKKNKDDISFLDIGTGTGILAIAAAVMGVKDIDAFDASLQAYECARKNVEGKYPVHLICCDIKNFNQEKQYDIITANLMTTLIVANAAKLSSLTKDSGYCIVSGIIDERKDEVIYAFRHHSFLLKEEQTSQGWFAGVFQKL
ncbi:MAG: 50S ribosomal protein L11 methyltransferase [Spirochaetes bacterium]|nr:50S ribosomal protein L11 methyltransferase [Spirochaetota bacterium]